jgi:hypothetical protein
MAPGSRNLGAGRSAGFSVALVCACAELQEEKA